MLQNLRKAKFEGPWHLGRHQYPWRLKTEVIRTLYDEPLDPRPLLQPRLPGTCPSSNFGRREAEGCLPDGLTTQLSGPRDARPLEGAGKVIVHIEAGQWGAVAEHWEAPFPSPLGSGSVQPPYLGGLFLKETGSIPKKRPSDSGLYAPPPWHGQSSPEHWMTEPPV